MLINGSSWFPKVYHYLQDSLGFLLWSLVFLKSQRFFKFWGWFRFLNVTWNLQPFSLIWHLGLKGEGSSVLFYLACHFSCWFWGWKGLEYFFNVIIKILHWHLSPNTPGIQVHSPFEASHVASTLPSISHLHSVKEERREINEINKVNKTVNM